LAMQPAHDVDFLVIGSGIAGLTYALQTSRQGSTLILTKKNRAESNSNYAQGGIAGVMAEDDDVRLHAEDTLVAGAGLCHPDAVDILVNEGPERIRELMALGAHFTMESDAEGHTHLALGREGGHSKNRIVHAVDRTGWECERTMLAAAKDAPNLQVLEHYFVVDLAITETDQGRRCFGAYVMAPGSGEIELVRAGAVLLATGGCGRIYKHTTNPAIATGDGVAMAWRAGATIANMEFIQFHPTALFHPEGKSFLITEAVRGEGGILRALDGSTFMENYHPLGALAPRDIVARAIHAERLKRGDDCVHLDITHLDPNFIRTRFPTIYERCLELGLDITKEPIPVVPAAHYACGGVQTDLYGRTNISGLYAAGEVTCTGVHGANRLASNSLLEAMVFGHRAAEKAVEELTGAKELNSRYDTETSRNTGPVPSEEQLAALRERLQDVMNDYVGIVRNDQALREALRQVDEVAAQAEQLTSSWKLNPDILELKNMAAVAQLIVRSALYRKESRGLHYTTDYPHPDDRWKHDTILIKEAT
jgi:L-aspartate oxidase